MWAGTSPAKRIRFSSGISLSGTVDPFYTRPGVVSLSIDGKMRMASALWNGNLQAVAFPMTTSGVGGSLSRVECGGTPYVTKSTPQLHGPLSLATRDFSPILTSLPWETFRYTPTADELLPGIDILMIPSPYPRPSFFRDYLPIQTSGTRDPFPIPT